MRFLDNCLLLCSSSITIEPGIIVTFSSIGAIDPLAKAEISSTILPEYILSKATKSWVVAAWLVGWRGVRCFLGDLSLMTVEAMPLKSYHASTER